MPGRSWESRPMAHVPMSPVAAHSSVLGRRRRRAVANARAKLFREPLPDRLARYVLGTAYVCQPARIADLPYFLWWMLRDVLRGGTVVPDPDEMFVCFVFFVVVVWCV